MPRRFIADRFVLCTGLLFLLARFAASQAPASVTVLPNTVTAGSSTTGYVALVAPAKSKEAITLSSSSTGVTVPSSVTVAAGSQTASFAISTTTDKTAVVTITASGGGGSAVGFMMVQAVTVTVPSFSGMSFSPTLALSGQTITGTISFKAPLLVALTFDLSSGNANFTVPSSKTANAGASSVSFPVTVGANATTGAFSVTATLAPGAYQNAWTGPTAETGSFAYLAGAGLPANYAAGFWVGQPTGLYGDAPLNYFVVPTLKTYSDGRLCMGGPAFTNTSTTPTPEWAYQNDSAYDTLGRVASSGKVSLESDPKTFFNLSVFEIAGNSNDSPPYTDSFLFDNSTLSFSKDGKPATLTVIGQPYTWSLTANPTPTFGAPITLGTYTFTRVQ